MLYLALMRKWVRTAPPDRQFGLRGGKKCCNSQSARLARVLVLIASGNHDDFYSGVARYTRKPRGNDSLVTRNKGTLDNPYALSHGWYLEQTLNLGQKQDICDVLPHLGLSSAFTNAVRAFVAAQPFDQYEPDERDAAVILANIRACEERERANPLPPEIERDIKRLFDNLQIDE